MVVSRLLGIVVSRGEVTNAITYAWLPLTLLPSLVAAPSHRTPLTTIPIHNRIVIPDDEIDDAEVKEFLVRLRRIQQLFVLFHLSHQRLRLSPCTIAPAFRVECHNDNPSPYKY